MLLDKISEKIVKLLELHSPSKKMMMNISNYKTVIGKVAKSILTYEEGYDD